MGETLPFNPEWDDAPVSNERSKFQTRLDTAKYMAISRAGEALRGGIDSGRAEQAGHVAIDISAKYAERSLKLLPPGTRLVGKFVGKRLIRGLAESGHDHLSPALDRVATRMDSPAAPASVDSNKDYWDDAPTPAMDSPAALSSAPASVDSNGDNDYWGDAPTPAYEVPLTPAEPKSLRERLHLKPKEAPVEPIAAPKSPNDDMW